MTDTATEQYYETLTECGDHLNRIRDTFGEGSAEFDRAAGSFAHCAIRIQTLTRGEGGSLWSEGDMSLGGQTPTGMTFGMVWFGKSGLEAYMAAHPKEVSEYDSQYLGSIDFPEVGEWSVHS